MSVFRINKIKDFTIMSNYHLKDKNLGLKAKGLLSVMLSLPEDWDYTINGLMKICNVGESSIRTTLQELKENNYLVVTKYMPNETKSGRIEYVYDIYEQPFCNQTEEKQGVENQGVENHPLYKYTNNKVLNNKKLNILNNNKKENIKEKEQISNYDWINDNEREEL